MRPVRLPLCSYRPARPSTVGRPTVAAPAVLYRTCDHLPATMIIQAILIAVEAVSQAFLIRTCGHICWKYPQRRERWSAGRLAGLAGRPAASLR